MSKRSINSLIDEPYFKNFIPTLFSRNKYKYIFHRIDFSRNNDWLDQIVSGLMDSYEKEYHPNFLNQINSEVTEDDVLTIVEMNLKSVEFIMISKILNLSLSIDEINNLKKEDYIFSIDEICNRNLNTQYSSKRNIEILLELYKTIKSKKI